MKVMKNIMKRLLLAVMPKEKRTPTRAELERYYARKYYKQRKQLESNLRQYAHLYDD